MTNNHAKALANYVGNAVTDAVELGVYSQTDMEAEIERTIAAAERAAYERAAEAVPGHLYALNRMAAANAILALIPKEPT